MSTARKRDTNPPLGAGHERTFSSTMFHSPTSPLLTPPGKDVVVDTSRLTGFVHREGFRIMYLVLLVISYLALRALMPWHYDSAAALTALLQVHAFITFILLHWLHGSPDAAGDGTGEENAHLTFWEQIDARYYGTPTRRFFTAVPIGLFFVTLVFTAENVPLLLLNALSTAVLVVAKHETLFGVRLFGINRMPD